jgi:Cu/Ag efflux pump CusA
VIRRENAQRRIVISANTDSRDLASLVQRWEALARSRISLPEGYALRFEGEFQAREAAARRIGLSFALVLLVVTVLLTSCFQSLSLALQVLLNIPLALIGGLALTDHLVGNISIATIVGFIAVGGVAARNGIMMISHYLHLMHHEGEPFSKAMIIRGTLERLVPVLMTALSAGIALVPLVLSAGEPGKEILHPVAVVIAGGLISSTLLDLIVTPAAFWLFGRNASHRPATFPLS